MFDSSCLTQVHRLYLIMLASKLSCTLPPICSLVLRLHPSLAAVRRITVRAAQKKLDGRPQIGPNAFYNPDSEENRRIKTMLNPAISGVARSPDLNRASATIRRLTSQKSYDEALEVFRETPDPDSVH